MDAFVQIRSARDTVAFTGPWEQLLQDDMLIPLLAIVLSFVLVLLLSMGGLTVAFVKALRGGGATRRIRQVDAQEAQGFQELQRGFKRMEERVDSLETLLMGRSRQQNYDREFE